MCVDLCWLKVPFWRDFEFNHLFNFQMGIAVKSELRHLNFDVSPQK